MNVQTRFLILRILEACCWRLASLSGRLDLLLGRWAERVRGAQLWAIDQALVAFQATLPLMPSDVPPAEIEPPVPDLSPPVTPLEMLTTDPGVRYHPPGNVLH